MAPSPHNPLEKPRLGSPEPMAQAATPPAEQLANQLEPLLAGTQCTQCGYPSCAAYAQALTTGAPANLCRPGGEPVAQTLAQALNRPYLPPAQPPLPPQVAVIDESRCIGCTLCQQACPTGAIVGAPKQLHTVLTDDCTGCGLCLPPCPVDCLTLTPAHNPLTLPAAASRIQLLVSATKLRQARLQNGRSRNALHPTASSCTPSQPVMVPSVLPPELAAKAQAARAKAHTKYTQHTRPRLPKLLQKKQTHK